jgi:hypothetical protein
MANSGASGSPTVEIDTRKHFLDEEHYRREIWSCSETELLLPNYVEDAYIPYISYAGFGDYVDKLYYGFNPKFHGSTEVSKSITKTVLITLYKIIVSLR